jgi:ribosomal protein L11 methyltransferase
MLPDIHTCITDTAPLILSGIIAPRADEIREKFAECGYTVVREEKENDWVALMAKKI